MSPMPKRYTKVHRVRLSEEVDKMLREKAAIMGLPPATAIRFLVEHSVTGLPTEAKR